MTRRLLFAAAALGLAFAVAGCRHRCCSSDAAAPPRPFVPQPPGVIGPPVGPGGSAIPPPNVPTNPTPAGGTLPPPDFGAGGAPAPSGRPSPELLLPDPVPGGPSSRSGYPAPGGGVLGAPAAPKGQSPEPPIAPKAGPKPLAPGLPGFVPVKEGVASGRRPDLDGFDALKRNGYRTAVYLHGPGADTSVVRELAEKKGLNFVAVETTPEKLADAADAVNKVVADRSAAPVYVFDDDGVRAGAVWYVHFRTAEQLNADAARIRANSLGLTDRTEEGKAFWVAIQQILAGR